jgi:hypothetical protein
MIGYLFTFLLWIPVAVLLWRMVVSKQRWPLRMGAAVAAMLTFVGSATAPAVGSDFRIVGLREWTALAICAAGPAYLFLWSRKHRGRGKSRTVSLMAAIVGFVPIAAALILAIIYAE